MGVLAVGTLPKNDLLHLIKSQIQGNKKVFRRCSKEFAETQSHVGLLGYKKKFCMTHLRQSKDLIINYKSANIHFMHLFILFKFNLSYPNLTV